VRVASRVRREKPKEARPLTLRGLENLTAFAKLYGYVRFFHPSDQAAAANWETIAVEAARKVEGAKSLRELIARLREIFRPIAPSVRIFPTGARPRAAVVTKGLETIRYEHHGVGLASTGSIYTSQRRRRSAAREAKPKPFDAELGPGITASVPLFLYTDSAGTRSHAPLPPSRVQDQRNAADRGTRLGAVIIAWNIFQHFYPYFDVVDTDWRAELPKALRSAATGAGPAEFHNTLRRLVAALKDGHGNVYAPDAAPILYPPLIMDWIGGDLVVTRAQPHNSQRVKPGDRILRIDGKPVEQAAWELRALTSGATEQWIRYRVANELTACNPSTGKMALEIEPYARPGRRKMVEFTCVPPRYKHMDIYTEPRPETVTELDPGIFYIDLDRLTGTHWKALIKRLTKAKGIIFDVRGYPGEAALQALSHLTRTPLRSARWNIPSAAMPEQLDTRYIESGWDVPPKKPYLRAKRVFLTDGRAISYAETVLGIVEHYKLGEIVGGPTAGTNGNINPFKLPGGYTVTWTGMKVLKHDGSQHHGIGILPTVPVSRTRRGVAEGKDEILLRGLEVVRRRRAPGSRPPRASNSQSPHSPGARPSLISGSKPTRTRRSRSPHPSNSQSPRAPGAQSPRIPGAKPPRTSRSRPPRHTR
jgi:C-terminal processing protease CtpA/Prc